MKNFECKVKMAVDNFEGQLKTRKHQISFQS